VWDAGRADYEWLREASPLADRYELDDLAPELDEVGVSQVVLVQAADNVADTENMFDAARRHACVAGVVAWVPLREPEHARALLDRWTNDPIVGVRHLIHRDPDQALLADHRIDATLDLLAERNLTFDLCAETTSLLALIPKLAARHPNLTLIIDHLAKPPIASRGWNPWANLLAQAAAMPNVVAKLSGLNTTARVGDTDREYQRYVDHAITVFGPERLMFGGDWPFALLAATSYRAVVNPLVECLTALEDGARRSVLAGTARNAYRL
jgi:L-fuconolactonase